MHIFLDVDGVLNTKADWTRPYSLNKKCVQEFVEFINSLYDVKIVLTSSWRSGFSKDGNHLAQISMLVDALEEYGITICDKTPVTNKGRQAEIEYYISRNDVTDYLVIDDDITLFSNPERLKMYITDENTGFRKKEAEKALNKRKGRFKLW